MSSALTEESIWDVGALLTVWYWWGFNCSSSNERERAKEEACSTTTLGGWTWFLFQNPQWSIERYCDSYISPPKVFCLSVEVIGRTLTILVVFALVWLACLLFLRVSWAGLIQLPVFISHLYLSGFWLRVDLGTNNRHKFQRDWTQKWSTIPG